MLRGRGTTVFTLYSLYPHAACTPKGNTRYLWKGQMNYINPKWQTWLFYDMQWPHLKVTDEQKWEHPIVIQCRLIEKKKSCKSCSL